MYAVNQPEVMIGNSAQRFDESGNLTDDKSREFLFGKTQYERH